MEILDLRHFSSADLRPLLDEEVEVWGKLLCWDYRGSSDMILRYVDAKILPGYAAVERGSIVGYSFFVYEGSKGVVGDLFVSPRRADARAIELQMVEHVIETLQQSPGILRVEAQLLTHQTGDLAANFVVVRISALPQAVPRLAVARGERSAYSALWSCRKICWCAAGLSRTISRRPALSLLPIAPTSIPRLTTSTAPMPVPTAF